MSAELVRDRPARGSASWTPGMERGDEPGRISSQARLAALQPAWRAGPDGHARAARVGSRTGEPGRDRRSMAGVQSDAVEPQPVVRGLLPRSARATAGQPVPTPGSVLPAHL